ncbi:hypothetical protein D1007_33626 [Hordeum vulgare]|nr:hypothetical protein D1007_33626 [Hordeum vulgare]
MSITLEDIAMISGLPIEGRALTGKVRAAGWRQWVAALVGVESEPWIDETRKDPRPSGVLFSWIQRHFHRCPRDAGPLVVERFARAYLWNLLTQVVFPDGTGDTASWMFLDPLRGWDVKWSWGSAALAFLYRQLDGACMRSKPTSCLGGFVWALQVNWRPYTVLRQYPLSNMCLRDQHLWRVRCPMICFYAVEWHLPHRVSKQFGVQQRTPPVYVETSVKLHKTNPQSNKTVINWEEHHITWVDMWNAHRQHRGENDETPDTDEAAYLRHLEWMRTEYRVIHKAVWTRFDCLDLLPSEAADAAFNNSIRETVGAHLDYGPLHDRVKVANRCRTLAALLSCHGVSSTDVRARAQYTMDVQSSARPSASRPRASSARPSSSGAHVSSSRAHEEEIEEEDESDNEAAD